MIIGILLGIATLIRPIAEFLIFVFPAIYLIRIWLYREQPASARWKAVGACVLGFAFVVLPWMVRNEEFFGSFEISNLGGVNLLWNDVQPFLAWRAAGSVSPMSALLAPRNIEAPSYVAANKQLIAELAAITPPGADSNRYLGGLAIRHIVSDPVRYAYFDAVNTVPFFLSSSVITYRQTISQLRDSKGFFAPATLSVLDDGASIAHPSSIKSLIGALWSLAPVAIEIAFWGAATILALICLVLRRRESLVFLAVVLVAYFALITGVAACSRYRIPAEPFLLILATAGLQLLVSRIQAMLIARRSARSQNA